MAQRFTNRAPADAEVRRPLHLPEVVHGRYRPDVVADPGRFQGTLTQRSAIQTIFRGSALMALPSLRTVDPGRERLRRLSRED